MRRRLRKKVHRRYLIDVLAEASVRSHWRRGLLLGAPGVELRIDARSHDELPRWLVRAIRRYGLSYRVRVVTSDDAPEWREQAAAGMVLFRFEASEFPQVHATSANNPAVV